MALKLKSKEEGKKAVKKATPKKAVTKTKAKAKTVTKKVKKSKVAKTHEGQAGRSAGWSNTSKKWKSIWHMADTFFKKHPNKDNKEVFALMEPEVKKDFKLSRFKVRNVAWYRAKYNKGIHPKR